MNLTTKSKRSFASALVVCALSTLLSVAGVAQSPSLKSADPGSSSLDSLTGLTVTAGYDLAPLFPTVGFIPSVADMTFGPGGDLYFTVIVGSGCSSASSTHIWRVPMTGDGPTQPLTMTPYTTMQIDGQLLSYDPTTDTLWATGTCSQTANVWRIPSTGVPELINASIPVNDPDGLAVGALPNGNPALFVTAQDSLVAYDLSTSPPTPITISIDLSATTASALGNWSAPFFDWNTSTLLAGGTGRPATRRTVEISFSNTTPILGTATQIGPDSVYPVAVDGQGMRWWRNLDRVGLVNPGPNPSFMPILSGLPGDPHVALAPSGSLHVTDSVGGLVYRLGRPMQADHLTLSAAAGGYVNLSLKAPVGRGNEGYLIVAGVTGSTPGTAFAGAMAPLNRDIISEVAYQLVLLNDPLLPGWAGSLDSLAEASAGFAVPPGILPANVTFTLAFILGGPEYFSNAAWIHILP